jgi:hypothetical protein
MISLAVIDGPYDAEGLESILAQAPIKLGVTECRANPESGCNHGTFVIGLLGARRDSRVPGLCPECELLHIPLFLDEPDPKAGVTKLANAINSAVTAGANIINLSLAVLGDEKHFSRELAAALDYAESSGVVVMAAAGNQGRLAVGQLLSHKTTVPVVALDAHGELLPESNFGPPTSRWVAALGHQVKGYGPGGGVTSMSGTSVATAVAAGTLAHVWSQRRDATNTEIRAALALLGSSDGKTPPALHQVSLLSALDRVQREHAPAAEAMETGTIGYAKLNPATKMSNGATKMRHRNNFPHVVDRRVGALSVSSLSVTPAHTANGCGCGAPGGQCSCGDNSTQTNFVYVLGSVDIQFPDQSIYWELQEIGRTLKISEPKDSKAKLPNGDSLRRWHYEVLKTPEARYIARQVCWVLTVERQPAYYLMLSDMHDLDSLIEYLSYDENDLGLFVGSSSLQPVEFSCGFKAPILEVVQLRIFTEKQLLDYFEEASVDQKTDKKTPKPSSNDLKRFFNRIVQSADNFGDTDAWRALNYLAVRYQPLYPTYVEMTKQGYFLDNIVVGSSRLARERRIVDPIFCFQNDAGAMRRHFVRVDVTHLFPMLLSHVDGYVNHYHQQ